MVPRLKYATIAVDLLASALLIEHGSLRPSGAVPAAPAPSDPAPRALAAFAASGKAS